MTARNSDTNAVLGAWNSLTVNGSIAGTTFSGATTAGAAPANAAAITAGATGTIEGVFYGPAAQELGGHWTVSDGNRTAAGAVIAGH
jgi:hypothetical protein